MSDVFCNSPVVFNREKVIQEGRFVRNLSGNEHPRSLLYECLHGPYLSCGKPQVFVFEGFVLAAIDGTECSGCSVTEAHLRQAINTVRSLQGRHPLLAPTW